MVTTAKKSNNGDLNRVTKGLMEILTVPNNNNVQQLLNSMEKFKGFFDVSGTHHVALTGKNANAETILASFGGGGDAAVEAIRISIEKHREKVNHAISECRHFVQAGKIVLQMCVDFVGKDAKEDGGGGAPRIPRRWTPKASS